MQVAGVLAAVVCGLIAGFVVGFVYGAVIPDRVIPDGLLPLLWAPVGAIVAGGIAGVLIRHPKHTWRRP